MYSFFLNSYFRFQIFRLGANRRTEVIDEFKANSVQVNDFLRACISQNAQRYVCRSHFLFLKCPLLCIPYLFSTSGKPPSLCIELGFYADISWKSKCNSEKKRTVKSFHLVREYLNIPNISNISKFRY